MDLQSPSYGPGKVRDSDPANIVGVIVKKVVSNHKPLEPVDDKSDPEDPEKPQVKFVGYYLIFTYIFFLFHSF